MKIKKILDLDKLSSLVAKYKKRKRKIVLCHGVFDLLHLGHIKHFEEAKKHGDVLIVTVTPDNYVYKGPNKPVFSLQQRIETLAALQTIDFVAANKWESAIETIKIVKPNIYCKGPDYKDNSLDYTKKILEEKKAIKSIGGKIEYTSDETIFSSSNILNKFGDVYSDNQKSIIQKINKKLNFKQINKMIDELKNLKVLVIGETIIDQYYFCEALGKSGKEPILVLRDLNMEQYPGGAAAVARHISGFCKSVTLLSMLGENGEYKNYIKNSLPKNINTEFIYKKDSPTIVKKKYVETYSKTKIFGVHNINDELLGKKNEREFGKKLSKLIPKHDLIMLTDYGHGLISDKSAKSICKKSLFLALNAQVNASNIGYHTMDKYKNVECVVINETELRHETRNKNAPIKLLMKKLARKLKIKNLIVTQGSQGSTLFTANAKKYYSSVAFASKIVDKVGAGDAMLAAVSLCLKNNFDKNFSLLVASLAAAQSVETIGNSVPINKNKILKSIQYLLK